MKRKISLILIIMMLAVYLTACAKKNTNAEDATEPVQQMQEPGTQNEPTTADSAADNGYSTRINISINPDADILTDGEGNVIEIVCKNDDAKTAYGKLEPKGKKLDEVAKEMVEAAVSEGFLQDTKPVTVTIQDADKVGQELLDTALEAKNGIQKALSEKDLQKSPIVAEITEDEVVDDTCDLCYGKGLLVCDGCNGTTYLDGNAWTTCGKCSGEGKTTCTLCNGNGQMNCDSCGGSGLNAAESDGKCMACHGEGKMNCVRCGEGAGYQQCEDCKGEGRLGGLPCPRCGGTLWAMCNRCNGSGKRNN